MDPQIALLLGQGATIILAMLAIWRTREKRQTVIIEAKARTDEKQIDLTDGVLQVLGKDVKNSLDKLTAQLEKMFQQNVEKAVLEEKQRAIRMEEGREVVTGMITNFSILKGDLNTIHEDITRLEKKIDDMAKTI